MQVLLVEDDDAVAEPLRDGLGRQGFAVRRVATGAAALADALEHPPDVVLLDLGLPDIDGYEVCRRLRSRSAVPIIVLTARSDETDRVVGLELGADDYVVKPFGFRELVARIRAVTRRGSAENGVEREARTVGELSVDRRSRRIRLAGAEIALTATEFDLVAVLAEENGQVVTRTNLMSQVYGHRWVGPTKTLDVHVASIRRKLGDPRWITTVRGVGFRLEPPAAE